ncbi:hypothetical protein B296_00057072 [Ensete ventricosum]|uniref:Uncharacterized protein n=1 Tax=Ensete ventricosum TaxID=4639 RepID=A0A426XAN1_ENSVE|nr:hypothetical protein B296_00057072 [Ensete ventricosum]
MRLGTRKECIGCSSRVSGVRRDGTREFARRRLRLVRRLSGVAEKLAGILTMTGSMELQPDNGPRSSLGIGPSSDDEVGSHWEFARRFYEGIGKLAGKRREIAGKKTGVLVARMIEAIGLCRS